MNKEPKETKNLEIAEELAPLAEALHNSEYPDILLYEEDDEYFTGECDGVIHDHEVTAVQYALLSTGILHADDLMPAVISSRLRDSANASHTKVLETRCILGDCWNICLSVAYTKDFKHSSHPVLQVKYCNERERGVKLTPGMIRLFEVEKDILMRRLVSDGKTRQRVKYAIREIS